MATKKDSSAASPAPRRRGRPHKNVQPVNSQFHGRVIRFDSRPRLMVGDVVELCRGCLPSNHGKLAVITDFDDEGFVVFRALWQSLDAVDLKTGEVTRDDGHMGRTKPENLYRRSKELLRGYRYGNH